MVFACLVLSVFSTIDEYEEEASVVLLKMVRDDTHKKNRHRQWCRQGKQSYMFLFDLSLLLVNQELMMVFWFAGEFGARIWSVGCRSRYQGWIGRLRFLRSPFCVIGKIEESSITSRPNRT